MKNTNRVSAGTIARTICLALALVNQVLTVIGMSPLPIEDETVTMLISTAATIITAVISWWKNQSFTPEARAADAYLQELKHAGEGVGE